MSVIVLSELAANCRAPAKTTSICASPKCSLLDRYIDDTQMILKPFTESGYLI